MRASSSAVRRLAATGAFALAALAVLAGRPDRVAAGPSGFWPGTVARADTDSVAVPRLTLDPAARPDTTDALDADSTAALAADTTDADSTARARAYFPVPVRTGTAARAVAGRLPGVRGRLGTYWRREVTLDSAALAYGVTEAVAAEERAPAQLTLAEFLELRRREAVGDQLRTLAAQRSDRRTQRRGSGLGIAVDIPGGDQSAFRTLFGKNEVALTVNGTSNLNLGVRYDRNSLQDALSPGGTPFAPDFGQDLNLNVAGTIGDKLAINVNYDTQSQFDFENQVSLVYTGYDDDIIQRIEAGNVFLQTPATLIRGGQRLFGLRTDLQFGPLALTAVASQQDSETIDRVFEGGSDAQVFTLAPYEYEDDTHFFIGYAFHNWWDAAHERPSNPILPPGFSRLIGIEVWKHEPGLINTTDEGIETTWAVALADLAEPPTVLAGGEAYLGDFNLGRYTNEAAVLPDSTQDQYSAALLARIRQDGATVTAQSLNANEPGVTIPATGAFSNNVFRRLRANVDYTFDPALGWLSLTTRLTESDLLAVAYQYETFDGRIVTVGDYGRPAQSNSQTGPRTILKLLRADRQTPTDPLWDLTLRNVYRVGGRSLNETNFSLDVTFEPAGASALSQPRDISFEQRTFLQVLGLDRVNGQGLATADEAFDFRSGVTIQPDVGRVIFPVRQPFGDYLEHLIETGYTVGTIGTGDRIEVTLGSTTLQEALDRYVPTFADGTEGGATLYDLTRDVARIRLPRLSAFRIAGEYRSATQSVFNIGFQLVEGTVRVTSGELELTENVDYRVNYTGGSVEIINPQYLLEGQRVRVEVEQQDLFSIGSKTLLGLRADYRLAEDFNLGATWMQLAERPLGDKFRIGEEPLSNSIVGLDGSYQAEPRWLTRAIDALPLLQTRAPSRFEIRGEVARLNPGSPQTLAFDRTRESLQAAGLDFAPDELAGISYVDDFEGSENAFTALRFTAGWRIAAPPDSAGPPESRGPAGAGSADSDVTDPILRTNWRGLFAWYSISEAAYRAFSGIVTPATEPVPAGELFSERDFEGGPQGREAQRPLDLLDLYFDPTRRGPYNFNRELSTRFAQNPRDAWGGFVRQIESSYSNFDGQNNIEFVELLVAPLGGYDGTEPIADGAVLYIDLGRVNEDVLPNGFLNSEDGLQSGEIADADADPNVDAWGRRPSGRTNGFVDFNEERQRTEDLGLDGLPSRAALSPTDPYPLDEATLFRRFLDALPVNSAEQRRAALDPAGDDFYNFQDPQFNDGARYPNGPVLEGGQPSATIQERYAHYFPAFELNSATAQQNLVENGQGISVLPNSEDVNENNTLDVAESFHRYQVPLDATGIASSPFFLNTLTTTTLDGAPQTWYLLRIPVRTQNRQSVGIASDDFSRIETVRVWTTGHDKPATLRIASFELVGSQWLKSQSIGEVEEDDEPGAVGGAAPQLFVETINNEENDAIYAIPRGTVQNTARSLSGQLRVTREQALVFRAEGLVDGRRAGLVRSYATRPLDLTKYSNLRVSVHGDGFDRRDEMRAFVRFGDDETENYYEIEQPVYPFDPEALAALPECPRDQPSNCVRSDSLWQTNVGPQRVDLNPINVTLADLNRAKLERDRAGFSIEERFTTDAGEGAPPGAQITVRGQPSIQDVRTVVLGVRNGLGGSAVVDTVSVWFNELRATGYDEGGGASGFLTANVAFADVGRLDARLSFTNDGFGELGGALGGRGFAEQTAFTLTSSFNAHKLLPERYGWQIPVSYSITENGSTPRFDPDNGDVRLDDLVDAARALEGEPTSGTPVDDLRADAILERARTTTSSRNARVSVSKTGSRSAWLRYTVDGLTAAYSSSSQDGANPSNQLQASDSWTTSLNYRLAVPRPLAVRPFWLLDGVPLAGSALGGLRVNLLPSNVVLAADANRSVTETRPRLGAEFLGEPDSVSAFRALTRRTQRFQHGRTSSVQYTPLPFLQLSLSSDVSQDLGAAGQNETFRVLVRERTDDGSPGFARTYAISPSEARTVGGQVYNDLVAALDGLSDGDPFPTGRVEILGGSDLEVLPFGAALGNAFGGDLRTQAYGQRASGTLRVSTGRLAWLRWLQLQPISYSADYDWRDQPSASAPDLKVASAGTRATVQTGVKVMPRTLFRLLPFYRALEEAAGRGQGARRPAAPADSAGAAFSPLRLARDAFLAVTAVDDVSVTYRGSSTAAASGVDGGAYSLLSGLTGAAPGLGYRLGFDNTLGLDRRVTDDRAFNTFSDALGAQHDVDARTQLSPVRGLSVGLSWRTAWSQNEAVDFQIRDDGGDPFLEESAGRRVGGSSSTIVSFGGTYEGLVRRHADRFLNDALTAQPGDEVETEFLSPTGLADDFHAELGGGLGSFGLNGLFQIPLPNWTVSYSGLERLPLVRKLANQISLQHGYSATSESGFETLFDPNARIQPFRGLTLLGAAALADGGYDEPTNVTVSRRFQPLLGLTFGFKGGIQTSVSTNRTSLFTLQAASAQVIEKTASDLRVDFSYARQGLRLFGLRGINNNIRLQLTALVANDATIQRTAFTQDLRDFLDTGDPDALAEPTPIETARFQLSPQITYTVSNQVTASLVAQYDRTSAERTGQTNRFTGGVTLRILFSN